MVIFTFSRSTAATRVNADGNIEKETQNLLLQSNAFTTTWIKTGSLTLTSGQSGYDGSSDAWKLDVSQVFDRVFQSTSTSGVHTFSVYAKKGSLEGVFLRASSSDAPRSFFNLNNGTLGNPAGNLIDAAIEDVGGGWYRCSITYSDSVTEIRIYPANADNTFPTSGNIYIQDAQLEQGLVARDYIETTTTAVEGGITDNVPRLDYTDSSCPSLLLEPQRTNLVTNSELGTDLDVQGGGVTNNETTSPEGFNNAYKFLETTYAGNHGTYKQITGLGTGTDYAVSVFVKKLGRRYVGLQSWYGSSDGAIIYVDLDNGTIEDTYAEGTGYSVSKAKIDDYGNGWYRISGVFQSGNSNQYYGLVSMDELWTSGTSYDNVFAGDVTKGFYSYGLQLEAGSYATSYIPTYGSAVTRNAETCNKDNIPSLLNDDEGTLFVNMSALANAGGSRVITIGDGTGANRVQLFFYGTNELRANVISSTVSQVSGFTYTGDQTANIKALLKYKANDVKFYVNGTLVASDTSATMPSGLDVFRLNNGTGSAPMYADIKNLIYIPTSITDQECIDLTTL